MPRLDLPNDPTKPGRAAETESRVRGLSGLRILVVEDNGLIAAALEEILSEQGLIIAGVASGLEDALRLAASAPLDLALLDVNIGEEKIDSVAETLALRGTPFAFTTGYGRAGLPEAFRERPMVEKPFYIDDILSALRAALASVNDNLQRS